MISGSAAGFIYTILYSIAFGRFPFLMLVLLLFPVVKML